MKKKVLALVLVIALALALSVTAFAADGVTEKEDELLKKFAAGTPSVATPKSYIAQAEQYLAKEDLTDAQISDLSAAVDSVLGKINEGAYENINELKESEEYDGIVKEIQAAALKINYKVGPGDPKTYGADIVKQTGSSVAVTVAVVALLSAALVAAFVVAGKKNLFSAQA